MLALTRFADEHVDLSAAGRRIGRVRVAWIKGDKVALAFDFPPAVAIERHDAHRTADRGSRSYQAQARLQALLDLYPLGSNTVVSKHVHEIVDLLTGGE